MGCATDPILPFVSIPSRFDLLPLCSGGAAALQYPRCHRSSLFSFVAAFVDRSGRLTAGMPPGHTIHISIFIGRPRPNDDRPTSSNPLHSYSGKCKSFKISHV